MVHTLAVRAASPPAPPEPPSTGRQRRWTRTVISAAHRPPPLAPEPHILWPGIIAAGAMERKMDNLDLGFSPIDGRAYKMGGKKPFNPKDGYNPVADVLNDDCSDAHNTLPAKLIAIEDSIEDFCGKPTRVHAEAIGGFGHVHSRCVATRRRRAPGPTHPPRVYMPCSSTGCLSPALLAPFPCGKTCTRRRRTPWFPLPQLAPPLALLLPSLPWPLPLLSQQFVQGAARLRPLHGGDCQGCGKVKPQKGATATTPLLPLVHAARRLRSSELVDGAPLRVRCAERAVRPKEVSARASGGGDVRDAYVASR